MKRIAALILVVSFLWIRPCYCQDAVTQKATKQAEGIVVSIDWVASLMVVRVENPSAERADEIRFFVPDNVKVTRGTETIAFSDIEEEDVVTAEA